ncbi:hypothetical protein FVR03_11180 [Pontibacter qinzhouensis]|uniref:Tetratricopeptide repeat protein n=1 Tax=Pontibacter qinzhouensis TaxID=2603253 RepID=A0A5C8K6N9_9BACT|nr:hypothetical protein [Pontibacter qinzhouensis]TXK46038.1 hypothetical protein FVR03_11180 [Pontibacter qinzhouensis]
MSTFHDADNPQEVVVEQYINTQTARQPSSEKNLRFIFTRYLDFNATATLYFLLNQQKFLPYFQKEETAHKAKQIISRAAQKAGYQNDTLFFKNMQKLIATSLPDTSNFSALARINFLGGQQNWLCYAEETLTYATNQTEADWMTLNETATYSNYFSKENEVLQTGAEIMARAVEIEKSYDNLLLFAQLLTKAGNDAAAMQAATEAVTVATQTGEDSRLAATFIRKLKKNQQH